MDIIESIKNIGSNKRNRRMHTIYPTLERII